MNTIDEEIDIDFENVKYSGNPFNPKLKKQ